MSNSPLLDLPGAVPATGVDTGVAWHYGDPMGEQRAAGRGPVLVDLSASDVLTVTGDDRMTWLHTLTSQYLTGLPPQSTAQALILSPQGHVEHEFTVAENGDTAYLATEPGAGAGLLKYLTMMVFWSKADPQDAPSTARLRLAGKDAAAALLSAGLLVSTPEPGRVTALVGGGLAVAGDSLDLLVPRDQLGPIASRLIGAGVRPVGSWAAEALRIADGRPRLHLDTDEKTIPNELPWLRSAVHLHKGCYRGQETVARVDNLGRPPRRLVRLHLDGSIDRLPEVGAALLTDAGRVVGRVGSSAHHHENGPMALALVKRSVPVDAVLLADGVDARQEPDDVPDDDGRPQSAVDHTAFARDARRR
jgi:tRNA-modifying protein YgfZ